MTRALCVSPSAPARLARARQWLAGLASDGEARLVGASIESIHDLARDVARERPAVFGWHRFSLGRLAALLAASSLAEAQRAAVSGLALEAVCARVVSRLAADGALGRFAPIGDRPGLPRALARTLSELRMSAVRPDALSDPDLARALRAYEDELDRSGLADRADVVRAACAALGPDAPLARTPLLLLDVALGSSLERRLVAALAEHAPRVLATVPEGDARSLALLEEALGTKAEAVPPTDQGALGRLARGLFADANEAPAEPSSAVTILSAPGEARECVEIARRIHREAEAGVPFDRMAVLLRSPPQYRAYLEEALRRAGVPVFFSTGTQKPDPTGRALLSLLSCAAEGLSARRFAEYLSLGELPRAEPTGAPPPPRPPTELWVAPDEELLPRALAEANEAAASAPDDPPPAEDAPVSLGTLRTPRRWEQMLVDAAVIGGLDRWRRRLSGLAEQLRVRRAGLEDEDAPERARLDRDLASLAGLRAFAEPLLVQLAALPQEATWGTWIEALSELATRALRKPDRVLSVLAELAPMADTGPVALSEVRLVLGRRLRELVVPAPARRYGAVFVGPAIAARGVSFDVVFVPGLAEKMFPLKVVEDPILRDAARAALDPLLDTNDDRVRIERLALRLAVGAAEKRLVASFPRLDADQSRPRTPSFYGLEILRAAEGKLPGFDVLARRADDEGRTRLGWPAPDAPEDAIDDAEHDLSLLARVFALPEAQTMGTARYLLDANPHLARGLRARGRRWRRAWFSSDGFVKPVPEALALLQSKHGLAKRTFSPTAMQGFASCPYRFFLYTIHKLSPRQVPEKIEEMDALQKGSFVHDVLFTLHVALRDDGALPVTERNVEHARKRLDEALASVATRYEEKLAPAIKRVWDDGIDTVRADLREWLRRAVLDPTWVPAHFELSFGLTGQREESDPASRDEGVALDCGIQLRGSIDLVERGPGGDLRASDYKTGKARGIDTVCIGGGEVLQPVFYALVLEKIFPQRRVDGGRLYYCTTTGDFRDVSIALDDRARASAALVADALGSALDGGFLPAAPAKDACEWCDYQVVCGPYEELRVSKKSKAELHKLKVLRDAP